MMKFTFGQILREKRRELALSQAELAEKMGVSVQTISRWETDSGMPDISQIVPLARLLGTTTDILLGMEISEDEAVNDILEEGERLVISHGVNALTLGVGNDGDYFKAAYLKLFEKTKKYPYNSKLLIRCADYGLIYLRNCVRRKYPITEDDLNNLYKDIKRMLTTVIDFGDDIECVVSAKQFLTEVYACMGNESGAYEVVNELPRKYKLPSQFRVAKILNDHEKKKEFGKLIYENGFWDFTCSCMTLYESYTVLGKPEREKALEVLEVALAFLETVHGTIDEEYYLQDKIIYLKRMAMEYLRDGDFERCLDCIETITDSLERLYFVVTEPYTVDYSGTFKTFSAHGKKSFGENPQKKDIIDGLMWTLKECYAECGDRENNPIVTSERYKNCVNRIMAL